MGDPAGLWAGFGLDEGGEGGEVRDAFDAGVEGEVAVAVPIAEEDADVAALGEELGGASVVVDVLLRAEGGDLFELVVGALAGAIVDDDAVDVVRHAVTAEPGERGGAAAGEDDESAVFGEASEGVASAGEGATPIEAEVIERVADPARPIACLGGWGVGIEEVAVDAEVASEGWGADHAIEIEREDGAIGGHAGSRS